MTHDRLGTCWPESGALRRRGCRGTCGGRAGPLYPLATTCTPHLKTTHQAQSPCPAAMKSMVQHTLCVVFLQVVRVRGRGFPTVVPFTLDSENLFQYHAYAIDSDLHAHQATPVRWSRLMPKETTLRCKLTFCTSCRAFRAPPALRSNAPYVCKACWGPCSSDTTEMIIGYLQRQYNPTSGIQVRPRAGITCGRGPTSSNLRDGTRADRQALRRGRWTTRDASRAAGGRGQSGE